MKTIITALLITFSIEIQAQEEKKKDSIFQTIINNLDEVVIKKEKAVYVQKSDRLIFNVQNSIIAEGGTALEVLARAPGVSVSQEGDLSIRGQKGVAVMIDGKLTQLSQKELANYLKSTSSSNIKQIEVITNPSSKYDATGKAGMINIVLKKSSSTGLKGTAFTNYGSGRKNRTNSGLNLSYNKNKFGISGNYNYAFRGEEERKKIAQIHYTDDSRSEIATTNYQNAITDEPLSSNNFKLGTNYQVTPKTNLQGSVDAKIGRYQNTAIGENTVRNKNSQSILDVATYSDNKENWYDYTYAFSGIHKFNNEGKNINFDLEYENSKFKSIQFQSTENKKNSTTNAINDRRGLVPSQLKAYTLKFDFANPQGQQQVLEWGVKAGIKTNNNPSTYQNYENEQWFTDSTSTNHFKYDEQIYAGYVAYKYKFNKLNFQVGLRTEYTEIGIDQKTLNEKHKKEYLKWFPSFSVNYEVNDFHSFHTSYSKRINRPSSYDLNPFRFYDDAFNYSQGNPNLIPEITHTAEIAYNWKNVLMTSFYFSQTKNVFTEIYQYNSEENTTALSQINLEKSYNYGINATNTTKIYSWWSTNTLFNVFKSKFQGNIPGNNTLEPIITYNLNFQNAFTFEQNWKAEMNALYQSKSNAGIYTRNDFFNFSVGISKQILNKKGSIKLNFTDVFEKNKYTINATVRETTLQKKYNLDSRVATISFTYQI